LPSSTHHPANLWATLQQEGAQQAIRISLTTSLTTVLITLVFGTPVALQLSIRQGRFNRLLDSLIDLPIVMPPAVAGVALLVAFGRRGLLGDTLTLMGISLPFTQTAVIMAQTFIAAPLYIKAAKLGFSSVDIELKKAAAMDGASRWQLFRFVIAPMSWMALLSGCVLTWARALGEFGATLIFAGNFPGRTQTMPLAIYLGFEADSHSPDSFRHLDFDFVCHTDRSERVSTQPGGNAAGSQRLLTAAPLYWIRKNVLLMKTALFTAATLVLLALACAGIVAPGGTFTATPPLTITVMAAASLGEAFQELGRQFEAQHSGMRVQFNFAGSQQLAQQLAQGAEADVFASANQEQMDVAVQAGRVATGSADIFTHNQLAIIYPANNPAGLVELGDLARPGLKLVLAASEVPAGRYGLEMLEKASGHPSFSPLFKEAVLQNVVSYETNVKSVLAKVALGEADAGIVYTSDVNDQVGQIAIPEALNVSAAYPIATIQDGAHADLAGAFVDLVLSPDGQQILIKYGFIPITDLETR
jgi:molybdenum ABC transporter molybdate-binding protein